jgi:EpsI family protein
LTLTLVTGLAVLCASVWPAVPLAMNRADALTDVGELSLPEVLNGWHQADRDDWHWHPAQPGADRVLDQLYISGSSPETSMVSVHLRQYLLQRQDLKLVDRTNPWRPDRSAWRVIEHQRRQIDLGGPLSVDEVWVVSARQNLLVWSWYRIDDRDTANPYLVKLLEAKQQILEGRRQGTRVFVATPLGEDRSQARQILQQFVTDQREAIEASLEQGIRDRGTATGESVPGRIDQ